MRNNARAQEYLNQKREKENIFTDSNTRRVDIKKFIYFVWFHEVELK